MTKTKTTPSPFPPAAKRKTTRAIEIDPDLLKVETDTPVPRRSPNGNKYLTVFARMKPGHCIRCEPREVGPISNVLRKAIEMGRLTGLKGCKVITRMRCEDGHGRVWVVKAEK